MAVEPRIPMTRARWFRLAGLATAITLAIEVLTFLPHLTWMIPRSIRRAAIEAFYQGLLVLYALIVVLGPLGMVLLGGGLYRARRCGLRRPVLARALLLCASSTLGLILAEASVGTWQRRHALPPLEPQFPPLPTDLAASPREEIHLVVLGGSSAEGEPYQPWLSIGPIIGWQLERALPGRRVSVDVRAVGGADLRRMYDSLADLERRPDAVIIYSGHNEYQARYLWGRIVPPDDSAQRRFWVNPRRWLADHSPICQTLFTAIEENRLDAPPGPEVTRQLIDLPPCYPEEAAAIRSEFRSRLERMVAYCERIGALPIVVIPCGNDAGFEPSRSVPPHALSDAAIAGLTRRFEVARAAEADPPRAIAAYRALLAGNPWFAEAHFRLARLLAKVGAWGEAEREFILARDTDGFPMRCPSDLRAICREVAARHNCLLVDAQEVFRRISPHGILDDRLFHDAHHPVLRGYVALAQEVLRRLRDRGAFGWRTGAAPAIDLAECARHFGMDAERWAVVCDRTKVFFLRTATMRFDPTERYEKAKKNAEAARRIRAGVAPEDAGISGLGTSAGPVP